MAQDSTVSTRVTFDRRPARASAPYASVGAVVDDVLRAADAGAVRDTRGRLLGPDAVRELHWWLGGYLREAMGARKLRDLRTHHLQDFLDGLEDSGVSPQRLRRVVEAMGTLYQYARERGLAAADPTARLEVAEAPVAPARRPDRLVARVLELATAACAVIAVGLVMATVA
jgi:hypothetical protein